MNTNVIDLLKDILYEMEKDGLPTGKTRLIKLLYLLEVEYYRLHQERLTDLIWRFHFYGPYPDKIDEVLGAPDLEEIPSTIKGDRDFKRYTVVSEQTKHQYNITEIQRLISHIVKDWGGLDLYNLLDYVYFETEPMENVKRGDILAFSKIQPYQETKLVKIRVDSKKIDELKQRIKDHIKNQPRSEIKVLVDKELNKAMQIWDEDSRQILIKGKCSFEPENYPSKETD
ncbi:MAG: DUF4065 domain-containing protein [Candidatus Latescibacteria bacterium]|nr:DUF4065 domain-containing protein [Candidatus Latescibacterota bacterium]